MSAVERILAETSVAVGQALQTIQASADANDLWARLLPGAAQGLTTRSLAAAGGWPVTSLMSRVQRAGVPSVWTLLSALRSVYRVGLMTEGLSAAQASRVTGASSSQAAHRAHCARYGVSAAALHRRGETGDSRRLWLTGTMIRAYAIGWRRFRYPHRREGR